MNNHLEALRQNIIADTVAECTDFEFTLSTDQHGNLTIDYRGEWQPRRDPDNWNVPYLTIKHDGERFFTTHYQWNNTRIHKTLKGAAKYANAEIRKRCDNARKQKEKEDQEKAFADKSVQILREFHDAITRHGISAKLRLKADRYLNNHVTVDIERLNTEIDVSVTSDYRLEMYLPYPRFYTDPDTAINVLSAITQKGSA